MGMGIIIKLGVETGWNENYYIKMEKRKCQKPLAVISTPHSLSVPIFQKIPHEYPRKTILPCLYI